MEWQGSAPAKGAPLKIMVGASIHYDWPRGCCEDGSWAARASWFVRQARCRGSRGTRAPHLRRPVFVNARLYSKKLGAAPRVPSVASAVHICRGVAWPILAYPSCSVVVRMRSRGCRIGPSGSLPEGTVLYVCLRGNGAAFGNCRPAQRGSWSFLEGTVDPRT
jgi:hypothetical protein